MSPDENNLLARLDERTRQIKSEIGELRSDLNNKYVTNDQFTPVRLIVYGLTAIILSVFMTALAKILFV